MVELAMIFAFLLGSMITSLFIHKRYNRLMDEGMMEGRCKFCHSYLDDPR